MAGRPSFDSGWQLALLRHTRRWMRPIVGERSGPGVYVKWRGQWWLLGPRVTGKS